MFEKLGRCCSVLMLIALKMTSFLPHKFAYVESEVCSLGLHVLFALFHKPKSARPCVLMRFVDFLFTFYVFLKAISNAGDQTHKMSTERCVNLILAGLSNRIKEMWIAQQPFLLFFYLWQYTPTIAWFITNILGRKRVQNFKAGLVRESSVIM